MIRGFSALLALLAVAAFATAQNPDGVIRLTCQPAAAPSPALRYRLLPELRDRTPGNAALLYYRAFAPEWTAYRRPEIRKLIDQWLDDKSKPPDPQLRFVLDSNQLKEVDRAARRAYCDWELAPRLREDGIGLLLPDVQSFREYARILNLRAHFQIADGKLDDAVHTLQTGFSLGQDVANAPTLIQTLVGIAIITIQLGQVDELIQAPNSPNLYWALTDLPHPFIHLRKPLEGERITMDNLFPGMREALAKARSKPLTPEEAQALVEKLAPLAVLEGKFNASDFRKKMAAGAKEMLPEAKKYLVAHGWPAAKVEAMPALQAVLLHQFGEYDRLYDEMAKWKSLPYWQARVGLKDAEKLIKANAVKHASVGGSLASLLLPAISKVMEAQIRTERRIAALRCVEAVRVYAAAHEGKPPAKLEDIQGIPIPLDPYTGKAFNYKSEKNMATIEGPAPEGERPFVNNYIRYEVTLKAKDAMK